jgi:hypothetical protein
VSRYTHHCATCDEAVAEPDEACSRHPSSAVYLCVDAGEPRTATEVPADPPRLLKTRSDRLADLAAIKDGWLDGEGKAITKNALAKAEELLNPHLFPTPEGGVSIETIDYDIIVRPDGKVDIVGGLEDDPSTDGTDAAHPAWWRGHEHGARWTAVKLTDVLVNGKRGAFMSQEVEEAAQAIQKLREKLRAAEAQNEALRAIDELRDKIADEYRVSDALRAAIGELEKP